MHCLYGYNAEMTHAWSEVTRLALTAAAAAAADSPQRQHEMRTALVDAILRVVYYWYNFMPLSRGSAAVGYVTAQGLMVGTGGGPGASSHFFKHSLLYFGGILSLSPAFEHVILGTLAAFFLCFHATFFPFLENVFSHRQQCRYELYPKP
jgi:hypothetical protein